jgi:phosphoribosylglycinamide formyltransferase 2
MRSQRLSEFDMHARAILGLPIDTTLVSSAAAEVVYGTGYEPSSGQLGQALSVPESDLRVFARGEDNGCRLTGVALATAADANLALGRAHEVAKFLR